MSLTDERYGEYKSVDQNRNKHEGILGKHRICLLYTSDAADD